MAQMIVKMIENVGGPRTDARVYRREDLVLVADILILLSPFSLLPFESKLWDCEHSLDMR